MVDDQHRRRAVDLDAAGDRAEGGDGVGARAVDRDVGRAARLFTRLVGRAVVGALRVPEEDQDGAARGELRFDEVLAGRDSGADDAPRGALRGCVGGGGGRAGGCALRVTCVRSGCLGGGGGGGARCARRGVFEFVGVVLRGRDRAAGLFDVVAEGPEARGGAADRSPCRRCPGGRSCAWRQAAAGSSSPRCCRRCGGPGAGSATQRRAPPRPPDRSDTDVRAGPSSPHSASGRGKLNGDICLGQFAPLRSVDAMGDREPQQEGRRRWRARPAVRLGVLLVVVAGLVAFVVLRPGKQAHSNASRCVPASRLPEVRQVPPSELGGLRGAVTRALPQRVGRLYEEGTVKAAVAWTDEEPAPPATSPHALRPAGYEMRWWAPNGDDVVADVLVFASQAKAQRYVSVAASKRCRLQARSGAASRPPEARNLSWLNPDGALQADVFLARGTARLPDRRRARGQLARGRAHQRRPRARLRDDRRARLPAARGPLRAGAQRGHDVRRAAATLLGAALMLAGCGKSNLSTTTTATAPAPATTGATAPAPTTTGATAPAPATPGATAPAPATPGATAPAPATPGAAAPAPRGTAVPLPHPLTAARAAAFAKAVELTGADVPGAHPARRSKTPLAREREAARCGGRSAAAIGGGRSPELQRGDALERESLSSGVEVLHDEKSVERDLAYAQTPGGLRCYERVLSRSLHAEADPQHQDLRRARRAAVGDGRGRRPRQGDQDPRPRRRAGRRRRRAALRRRPVAALRAGRDQALRHELRPADRGAHRAGAARRCCANGHGGTRSSSQSAWWLRSTAWTTVSAGTVSWPPPSMSFSTVSSRPTIAT